LHAAQDGLPGFIEHNPERPTAKLGCGGANLLEFYFCPGSEEVGVKEQASYAQSRELAAREFAYTRLLYAQDSFEVAGSVPAALDQLQNILM
jgi:hypothetical protein